MGGHSCVRTECQELKEGILNLSNFHINALKMNSLQFIEGYEFKRSKSITFLLIKFIQKEKNSKELQSNT